MQNPYPLSTYALRRTRRRRVLAGADWRLVRWSRRELGNRRPLVGARLKSCSSRHCYAHFRAISVDVLRARQKRSDPVCLAFLRGRQQENWILQDMFPCLAKCFA